MDRADSIDAVADWRPKRIAFLVDPLDTEVVEFDSILRLAVQSCGGGLWPIVPVIDGDISPQWWELLRAVDPDLIYALLVLPDHLAIRVQRYLAPYRLIEVSRNERTRRGASHVVDVYEAQALGVEDIPRSLVDHQSSLQPIRFFNIQDSRETSEWADFALRNFGALPATLTFTDAFAGLTHEASRLGARGPNALLEVWALERVIPITPRDLSRMYVARAYDRRHDQVAEAFQVWIGDTLYDMIGAWNQPLSASLDGLHTGLWLPSKLARDERTIAAVARWISRVFGGGGQQRQSVVLSYSVGESEMADIARQLSALIHMPTGVRRLKSTECAFPPCDRTLPSGPIWRAVTRQSERVVVVDGHALMGCPRPPFLRGGYSHSGYMVDLEVQYQPSALGKVARRASWIVPCRQGMSQLFAYHRVSRIIGRGLPSLEAFPTDSSLEFRVPGPQAVFEALLTPLYPRESVPPRHPERGRFKELQVSDSGARLAGVVRLFGGLTNASLTFEDGFWGELFLDMAGYPDDRRERAIAHVEAALSGILKESGGTLDVSQPGLRRIAERAAEASFQGEASRLTLKHEQINSRFDKHLNKQKLVVPGVEPSIERDLRDRFIGDYVESGILLQGSECICISCGTPDWRVIDELQQIMTCRGCRSQFSMPPEPEWSFRLNDLVTNAITRHGVIATIHALYRLSTGTRDMFVALPSMDIFEDDPKASFTDIDIIAMRDGRIILGEAKSHPRGFKANDFSKLDAIARVLLPDVVVLAAPGAVWPDDVSAGLQTLGEGLGVIGVDVQALHIT